MIINFKYRLYPSKKQEPLLQQQFFTANQTWNCALNIRQKELKDNDIFCSFKELYKTTRKHLEERDIKIEVTEKAIEYLAEAGFDPVFGARPLKRAIDENIEDRLAELILEGKVEEGKKVKFDYDGKEIKVEIV